MSQPTHPRLFLTRRFTEAVEYARTLHIELRKSSNIPYMAHLLGVTAIVMAEAGGPVPVTEDIVIAALLHDAVEDHGGLPRLHDIQSSFGPTVARLVHGLSDSFSEDGNDKAPWEARKQAYIDRLHLEELDALLISAADKLYNARAILDDYREVGPLVWQRFHRGRNQQLWYFRALLDVFEARLPSRVVSDLARTVNELDQLSSNEISQ